MADQTVVSAAAIINAFFETLTTGGNELDFTKTGEVYFVEANFGDDTNDGSSWEKAFKTLSYAITVSNANITTSAGYNSRNKIYLKADRLDEDLVVFPNKCDVIGVGSCDSFKYAGIRGNHVPANAANYGTRFINIMFEPQANTDIIILTSTSSGCEFIGCLFVGEFGSHCAPSAIDSTASPMLKILNCEFLGAFSGDVIDIGVGDASGTEIKGNQIKGGADNGIVITGVATVAGLSGRGVIADNNIQVADIVIDTRTVSVFNVYNNVCISGELIGTSSYVIDLTYASNNVITGADKMVLVPAPPVSDGREGMVYFVEGNAGNNNNDGLSWGTAFKTLAAAITKSNIFIAAGSTGWAARNKIYVKGDRLNEDLTTFPNKCDVIGVGSCDAYIGAGIIGNHEPANSNNYGTRFINMNFFPEANADIVILASTSSGVEFHKCTFIAIWSGNTAPSAIQTTGSPQLMIEKCRFLGEFTGDVIDILAGDVSGTRIVDNEIIGGVNDGIVVSGSATVNQPMFRGLIARNYIQVTAKVIDTTATSVFNVMKNVLISAASVGSSSYVIDPTFSSGNVLTGADAGASIPDMKVRTT